MIDKQVEAQTFLDVYLNVSALYNVLKTQPSRGVRRAELKQGEVTAEAIDFLADVEIKAKRALGSLEYYLLYIQLVIEDKYQELPLTLQYMLGQAFMKGDLNYDGAYRVLYYRAKNERMQDREEPTHFPEEEVNAEDILQ